MKITTWNCNMAFRKKAQYVLESKPDILIIPECEHPEKLLFSNDIHKPKDVAWFGKNVNKGLAVLSYGPYRFKVLDVHNEALQLVVPILVTGGSHDFTLIAIWANNPHDEDGQYVEQVWKALHCYKALLRRKRVILVGDFNSNTIWDKPRRQGNHSHVVSLLESKGISSAYHSWFKQEQGREQHPTLYLYRHIDKPYHLDYCFVSSYFSEKLVAVEVGDHTNWCRYSDHVPVTVTFDI